MPRVKREANRLQGLLENFMIRRLAISPLLEPMSLNNFSAMPYRLELLRASIELARYEKFS